LTLPELYPFQSLLQNFKNKIMLKMTI